MNKKEKKKILLFLKKKNQIKLDKIFEKNKIFKNKFFCYQNDLICGQIVLHCFINAGTCYIH